MISSLRHWASWAPGLLLVAMLGACSMRATHKEDAGADIEAAIGDRAPRPGLPAEQTTLSAVFGDRVRAVCFLTAFPMSDFIRGRFVENSTSQIDATHVLEQLNPNATDDDHVYTYLVDRDQRVFAHFRTHQLAPRFQVSTSRPTGLDGCWSADHSARVQRQTGGRIRLFLEDTDGSD